MTTQTMLDIDIDIGGQTVRLAATISGPGGSLEFGLVPGSPPLTFELGQLIEFLAAKVGADVSAATSGAGTLKQALPQVGNDLSATNSTEIILRVLDLSVGPEGARFSVGVDVTGARPTDPGIGLPSAIASWLSITRVGVDLAIAVDQPAA